jgi:hypothetical protein
MKTVKKYKYILAAVVLLAALTVARAFNPGIFRYDAVKWAKPSVSGGNLITPEMLTETADEILFVILDNDFPVPDLQGAGILQAGPGNLLTRDNIRKIRRNKGPVVLCSADASVSARIWIILSETGIRELYLLKKDPA